MTDKKRIPWQQKTFEKMVRDRRKGKVNFAIDEKTGYYVDPQIRMMNMGFRMGLTAAREHQPGTYIIGKALPNSNIPTFSDTPRIHSNFQTVNEALDQLQEEHPAEAFIVYTSVMARYPKAQK